MTERRLRWLVAVGMVALRALALTWRVRRIGAEGIDELRARGEPWVFTLWHGQLLPLTWAHRGWGVSVLISEHRDGELIARIAEGLGLRTVRGSTSRGAARALIALTRVLESGAPIGVTPDGPRGPVHSFAPGALAAAYRANAPVVVLSAAASRAWRLRSWDRFMIPKPFARVVVSYGPPTRVEGDSVREATEDAARFARMMDEATERAERALP